MMSTGKIIKYAILMFWVVCFLNVLMPLTIILNYLLIFLIVAHFLEFIIFYKKIKKNKIKNFLMVMIFGYLHIQKLDYYDKTKQ